jgi:hypothetical protein
MHIDIRPVARLRGPGAVDVPAALGPVFSALSATEVDLARLRVVCDWIQYRGNFTEPVSCRPVLAEPGPAGRTGEDGQADGLSPGRQDGLEIAIDLRRSAGADVATRLKEALAVPPGAAPPGWVVLEPWVPASESCIWRFNALYWHALSRWEARPAGSTSRRCPAARATPATPPPPRR